MMRINLLPIEERPLKQSAVRPEFIVGLVSLVILFGVVYGIWQENTKITELTTTSQSVMAREAQLQSQVQEVNLLRQELNELTAKEQVYQELYAGVNQSLTMIPRLLEHRGSDLWVEGLLWTDSEIEIAGYTRNMTSVSRYLNFLNERSEDAKLALTYPIEGTNFVVFGVEVKGVSSHD